MKASLRLRQFIAGCIAIIIALAISFLGFSLLFERHVERRFSVQLNNWTETIAAGISLDNENKIAVNLPFVIPDFEKPYSGLYWQVIDKSNDDIIRSRSLWDLNLPLAEKNGRSGGYLMVVRQVAFRGHPLQIEIAIDEQQIIKARNEFAADLSIYLIMLGLVLSVLFGLQIVFGLKPLAVLRKNVEKITSNTNERMEQNYYKELRPLTETINHLLDNRAQSIDEAQKRAGDLAHGLKSPLAALRNLSSRLDEQNNKEAAVLLRDLSRGLQRQIDRELHRARAEVSAHKGKLSSNLGELSRQLVRVLSATSYGEALEWQNNIDDNAIMPIDVADLAEALGTVLENAARHAKQKIVIFQPNAEQIIIDDDGEGMDEERRMLALQRGVRFDERAQSTGLGLAIAGDVLAPYGFAMRLEDSPLGGLRVIIFHK